MPENDENKSSPLNACLAADIAGNAVRDPTARARFDLVGIAKSLLVRTLIGLPLAPLLLYACIWASMLFGSAKIQATPAIMLGVVFGYAFGFGVAGRAKFVNFIAYMLVTLTISAVIAVAILVAREFFADLIARTGEKRFWFAAGAFGGTSIMCALIALKQESSWTNQTPGAHHSPRPE